jgi:hypothetical protein
MPGQVGATAGQDSLHLLSVSPVECHDVFEVRGVVVTQLWAPAESLDILPRGCNLLWLQESYRIREAGASSLYSCGVSIRYYQKPQLLTIPRHQPSIQLNSFKVVITS